MSVGKILGKSAKPIFKKAAKEVAEAAVSPEIRALQAQGKKLLNQSLESIDDKGALKSYALGASQAWKNIEELNKKLH